MKKYPIYPVLGRLAALVSAALVSAPLSASVPASSAGLEARESAGQSQLEPSELEPSSLIEQSEHTAPSSESVPLETSSEIAQISSAKTTNASDAQGNAPTQTTTGKAQKENRKKDPNAEKNKKEKKQQEKKQEKKQRERAEERNVGNFKSELDVKSLNGSMKDAFKTHPEFRKIVQEEIALEKRSRELARQIKQEKNWKKKGKMEEELRRVIEEHFDVRQTRRLYELKIFEERIQDLRSQIEARSEKRDRIVEKRLMDLIGTDEDLRF